MRVLCDFDGTISVLDSTDHVLARLGRPGWEALEADWLRGRITAAECMRGQIALVGGSDRELEAVLDEIGIDPGFAGFADWCAANAIPLGVVSDGVDGFIRRILARHGLEHLPVVSNRLAGRAGARRLEQPYRRPACGSGVCKCAVAQGDSRPVRLVYVGDGRSDFCVSAQADILFAKGDLAAQARGRGQAHHVFRTFHDVATTLDALVMNGRAVAS